MYPRVWIVLGLSNIKIQYMYIIFIKKKRNNNNIEFYYNYTQNKKVQKHFYAFKNYYCKNKV